MVASQEFRFGLGTTCGDSTRRKPTGETPGLRSPPFFSRPVGPPVTKSGQRAGSEGTPPPHVVHIGQPSGARRTEPGSGGETQGPHAPTAPRSDIPAVRGGLPCAVPGRCISTCEHPTLGKRHTYPAGNGLRCSLDGLVVGCLRMGHRWTLRVRGKEWGWDPKGVSSGGPPGSGPDELCPGGLGLINCSGPRVVAMMGRRM